MAQPRPSSRSWSDRFGQAWASVPAVVPLFACRWTFASHGDTLVDRADTQDTAVIPTVSLAWYMLIAQRSYSTAPDPVRDPAWK
eukprot:4020823-Amphidinium_carterae.1